MAGAATAYTDRRENVILVRTPKQLRGLVFGMATPRG